MTTYELGKPLEEDMRYRLIKGRHKDRLWERQRAIILYRVSDGLYRKIYDSLVEGVCVSLRRTLYDYKTG